MYMPKVTNKRGFTIECTSIIAIVPLAMKDGDCGVDIDIGLDIGIGIRARATGAASQL